ncbi:MAG: arginine N-succinyltransferase [Sphingomonadales bacterium]|nr:arginine N-succinyltransferase [Sphingomonadales bacterium]MDE2170330.1 arginine N-succinyltransferase [Sphingomonadales bacterium]
MLAPRPGQPFVRMARKEDLDALLALAALSGGGMTNLPNDRAALQERLSRSETSLDAQISAPQDEFYMLALEDGEGRVIGTASIFSRIGVRWPFYSYKMARVTHVSRGLDRMFSTNVLHLVNDFDGATEIAGLFLHPDARTGGMGAMLARSRYLFIAQHRERFGDQVVAELRGWMEGDTSPFWEAVAGPFFGGGVLEADLFNAMHGNQFIADLMPRYPIYTSMLPTEAREAIGRPHEKSLPAYRLLMAEDFLDDGYCDIFDAGPTVHARTDQIRTIRDCEVLDAAGPVRASKGPGRLIASGRLRDFRLWKED